MTTTEMSDIPESTLPYPPIHKDKKFVVLTDWSVRVRFTILLTRQLIKSFPFALNVAIRCSPCRDGTITNCDSNDCMPFYSISCDPMVLIPMDRYD